MPTLPHRSATPYRRLIDAVVLWAVLVFLLAFAVNAVGIYLAGSAVAWLQWLDQYRLHFLAWRLCLYTATAGGWIWARRRLLQRHPESRLLVRFMERIALPLTLLIEFSQWLGQS